MNITDQVQAAIESYENLPQVPLDESVTPESLYLATPDRLSYALGWIAANAIVGARFRSSAIDVLPVFHPENGWDRFLITRRVSCGLHANEPANKFGLLMIDGDEGLRLTTAGGRTKLELGQAMRADPVSAIQQLLAMTPAPKIDEGKHGRCMHTRGPRYPLYYNAVTELMVEYPGLVAAREIYIDDQEIDGQYHPLYLHSVALSNSGPGDRTGMLLPVIVYDWFQLQYGDLFAFFDVPGDRTVYRTEHGTWSRVRKQLKDESDETVKQRIRNWMRLDGTPNAEEDSPKEGLTVVAGPGESEQGR